MPSPWSAFIPVAAGATFVATWLLTPGPQVGAAAPASTAIAVAPEPSSAVPSQRTATSLPRRPSVTRPPRYASASLAERMGAVRRAKPVVAHVYYAGCNEVRAAGAAPLYRGQPGYRPEMDGDQDGIACEPHRRW